MNEYVTLSGGRMLDIHLHGSLWRGVTEAAGLGPRAELNDGDAASLDHWAATCENPAGQKADLARALAGLVRVAGRLTVNTSFPPHDSRAPQDIWATSR